MADGRDRQDEREPLGSTNEDIVGKAEDDEFEDLDELNDEQEEDLDEQ